MKLDIMILQLLSLSLELFPAIPQEVDWLTWRYHSQQMQRMMFNEVTFAGWQKDDGDGVWWPWSGLTREGGALAPSGPACHVTEPRLCLAPGCGSTQRAAARQVSRNMREIVHIQAGQCGNQIGAKVGVLLTGGEKWLYKPYSLSVGVVSGHSDGTTGSILCRPTLRPPHHPSSWINKTFLYCSGIIIYIQRK